MSNESTSMTAAELDYSFIQKIYDEIKDLNISEMEDLFYDENDILAWMEHIRWPNNNVVCPYCSSDIVRTNKHTKLRSYVCKTCKKYFSIRTNTSMQQNRSSLRIWTFSIYFVATVGSKVTNNHLVEYLSLSEREAQNILDKLKIALQHSSGQSQSQDNNAVNDINKLGQIRHKKHNNDVVEQEYHIVHPQYIAQYNKELTALGLRRLLPDAQTLCEQSANNVNLIASNGAVKCIKCENAENDFAISVNSRLRYKQFYLQEESEGAFVYIDLSNIYIGAQETSTKYDKDTVYGDIRLNYANILHILKNIDNIQDITVVGTHVKSIDRFLNNVEENENIRTHVIKNEIVEHKERFADEHLQIKMLHDMLDYKPNTAIIMTGDGNGLGDNFGFFEEIIRMHGLGWDIVLLSWENNCHDAMKRWVDQNGTYVNLDKYYKYITEQNSYLENPRKALQFVI